MAAQPRRQYEFGSFRVDSAERVVMRGDDIVPLAPRACDLLLALLENRGRVVGKDELMSLVWQDTNVEEANLSHHIYKLREALEEDGGPEYIQTVPRRGYRFVAAVTERHGDPAGAGTLPAIAGLGPPAAINWGGRTIGMLKGRNLIGRSPDCAVQIDAISVSREHAAIVVGRQDAMLEDLGSKNGTYLNGARVSGSGALKDGDEIRIGSVRLRFRMKPGLPSTRTEGSSA